MKTIETNVFEYDELSEEAKEIARNWYLDCAYDYDWYDYIYDEAKKLGFTIESFDLYRRNIEIKLHDTPHNIAKKIIEEHGKDCDTFRTAQKFLKDVEKFFTSEEETPEEEELNEEFKNALAEDYLSILREESDYIESEESVRDIMSANEYTFTEDGKRFG